MDIFASSAPAPLLGLHILMVEDDPDVSGATQTLLEEEGARVTALATAEQALDALAPAVAGFDLVVSDVILGGARTGFDVAATALARHPTLPVVLVTGYTGPAGSVPAALPCSVPVLLKPFRRRELLAAIAFARAAHEPLGRAAHEPLGRAAT
jgi:DNA-binding NtrC family response regulator